MPRGPARGAMPVKPPSLSPATYSDKIRHRAWCCSYAPQVAVHVQGDATRIVAAVLEALRPSISRGDVAHDGANNAAHGWTPKNSDSDASGTPPARN